MNLMIESDWGKHGKKLNAKQKPETCKTESHNREIKKHQKTPKNPQT